MHAARIASSVHRALSAPPLSLASSWLTAAWRWTLSRDAKDGTNTLQYRYVVISFDTLVEPPAPATPATHDDEALAAVGSLADEVQRVITGIPNNKALGMDLIPAELWKAGHEVTSNELAFLLDWILFSSDVPGAWRGGA